MEEERWTQLTINILATEAIMHDVGVPDAQIHPLQLSLSHIPEEFPGPRGYLGAHLSCFFCPLHRKYFFDGAKTNL